MNIGLYLFVMAAQYILRPTTKQIELTSPWESLDFPEADLGSPIPVVFGTRWVSNPNVVWYGDIKTRNVNVKEGSLWPFGIGDKKKFLHHKYYLGMHMAICHYPVDALVRIRAGDQIIYNDGDVTTNTTLTIDKPDVFGGPKQEGGVEGDVDIAFGAPDQPVNTYLQLQLESSIPAFRGNVCVILNQVYLAAKSADIRPWAYYMKWLDSASCGPNSKDMNPAHIINLALTESWGLKQDTGDIDSDSFTAASSQLDTEELGLSVVWQTSAPIKEFFQNVLQHIMGALYTDPETGKFTLKLFRQEDESVLTLNETNVTEVLNYERPRLSELVNQVTIHYTDREDFDQMVSLHNQGLIEQVSGIINSRDIYYDMVVEKATAMKLAARDLRNLSTPLANVKLIANREALGVRIGDVVTLDWSRYGISSQDLRVMNIDYGNLQAGEIRIQAIQDVYGVDASLYADPPASKWSTPWNEPADADYRVLFEVPYALLVGRLGSSSTVWDEVADDAGWVVSAIQKPSGDSGMYELWTRLTAGSYLHASDHLAPFAPVATLDEDIDPEVTTGTTITEVHDLDTVETETYCIIGTEFCEVTAIDAGAGTITLKRGVLDTVPGSHSQGDRVYFADTHLGEDPTEYASADVVKSKVLPQTSLGVLDIGDATEDTTTMADRMFRAYPPGNFQLNSSAWPAYITGALTLTWAHRDRLTQGQAYTQQDAGDIGPEAGTTYIVKIWDEEDDLIVNETGIEITNHALTIADEITLSALAAGARPNETMRVVLYSAREGFDAWQEHDFVILECRGYGMFYGDYYGE